MWKENAGFKANLDKPEESHGLSRLLCGLEENAESKGDTMTTQRATVKTEVSLNGKPRGSVIWRTQATPFKEGLSAPYPVNVWRLVHEKLS